jgi:hypothetical protein
MNEQQSTELFRALENLLQPHLQRSTPLRQAVGLLGQWLVEQSQVASTPGSDAGPVSGTGPGSGTGAGPSAATGGGVNASHGAGHPHNTSGGMTATSGSSAAVTGFTPEAHAIRLGLAPAVAPPRRTAAILPLKIGDTVVHIPTHGTTEEIGRARAAAQEQLAHGSGLQHGSSAHYAGGGEADLELIIKRTALKARSCEVAVAKKHAEIVGHADGVASIIPRINELVASAKELPHCFLWTLWRERPLPDLSVVETAGKCYDALSQAALLMERTDRAIASGQRADDIGAMRLLAEACSSLRVVVEPIWLGTDQDQTEAYQWLRRATQLRRVYLERHMTMADSADPANIDDLIARIKAADQAFSNAAQNEKDVKKHLNTIKYECASLQDPDQADRFEHHWKKLAAAISALQSLNFALSDPRLLVFTSSILLVRQPENTAEIPGFAHVTAALDVAGKFVAEREAQLARMTAVDDEDDEPTREWGADVLKVREWLRGQRIVVLGGDRRAQAIERIKDAFEVSEVEWVELQEHGTSEPVRSAINRAPAAAIYILVRLTGHLHGERADEWAKEAGVPCVWMKAGYNPSRMAHDTIDQVSEQLASRPRGNLA